MQNDLFAVAGVDHRLHEGLAIDNGGERADQSLVENGVNDRAIMAGALGAAANFCAWRGRVRRRVALAQCRLSLRTGKAPESLAALILLLARHRTAAADDGAFVDDAARKPGCAADDGEENENDGPEHRRLPMEPLA